MNEEIRFVFDHLFEDALGGGHGLPRALYKTHRDLFEGLPRKVTHRRNEGELRFLDLPHDRDRLKEIKEWHKTARREFDTYVNLGIGGSSLGGIALMGLKSQLHNELNKRRRGGMRCYFPENVDPNTLGDLLETLDPKKTVFGVISKSGSTAETMSQYLVARKWLVDALGEEESWRHMVFITDPEKGLLRPIAREREVTCFDVPDGVGGRFSVLSPVGLVPAACAGIDIGKLLQGARAMEKRCKKAKIEDNPALQAASAHWLGATERHHTITVLMPYCDAMFGLARWYVQLIGESLGKKHDRHGRVMHTGITPLPAVGATDQHSQLQLFIEGPDDKVVTFISVRDYGRELSIPPDPASAEGLAYLSGHDMGELLRAEQRATEMALTKNGRMNYRIEVPVFDAFALGQLFYYFEYLTVYLGEMFDIDAFDQPGVEEGKRYTYGLMGRDGFEAERKQVEEFFGE